MDEQGSERLAHAVEAVRYAEACAGSRLLAASEETMRRAAVLVAEPREALARANLTLALLNEADRDATQDQTGRNEPWGGTDRPRVRPYAPASVGPPPAPHSWAAMVARS